MLKSVKQFFALSLCLLLLIPFVSAAFVDPGNTVAPLAWAQHCTCGDYAVWGLRELIKVYQRGALYCHGSYIIQEAWPCLNCGGYMAGSVVESYFIYHDFSGGVIRCNKCGWLINDT